MLRAKTIKRLEGNIGINLHDLGLGKFLKYDIKSISNNNKIYGSWTSVKLKTLCI